MKKVALIVLGIAVGLLAILGRMHRREAARERREARAAEVERLRQMTHEERIREELYKEFGILPESAEAEQEEPEPLSPTLRFEIGRHVAQGLRQAGEIVDEICWDRGCSEPAFEEQVSALVSQAIERNVKAAKKWPKRTDCDRLAKAYESIRRLGLVVVESVDVAYDGGAIATARDERTKANLPVHGFVFQADVFQLMDLWSDATDSDEDLEPSDRFRGVIVPVWYGVFGEDPSGERASALRPMVEAELRRAGLKLVARPTAPLPPDDDLWLALLLHPRDDLKFPGEGGTDPVSYAEDPVLVQVNWQRRRP
ncbi:MAG: hypothetical protein WBV82_02080 [Myxococcaceae bacterium]